MEAMVGMGMGLGGTVGSKRAVRVWVSVLTLAVERTTPSPAGSNLILAAGRWAAGHFVAHFF